MKIWARAAWLLAIVAMATVGQVFAEVRPEGAVAVPPALEPWRGFALYGAARELCPPDGNNPSARICLFPTSLALALDATGASFTLRARLFDEGPVLLPRGEGVYFEGVKGDGKPVPVTDGDGAPVVWLPAGEHELSGRLGWRSMPAALALPPDIGVVRLVRGGVESVVTLTPAGELRLADAGQAKPVENRETVKVFRLASDGAPFTVTSLFRLEVSGLARTITLAAAVPAGAIPLAVRAPVPAAFGPDGSLVLDAGPGRYDVEVVARYPGRLETLGPAACPYGPEIWSFQAAGDMRGVRPEGLSSIDPQTADVPAAWKGFPAFWAKPGATLTLRELGRGAPVGRDALVLSREMWLDFSGRGLSVRDTLNGENREHWTLTMLSPGALGRVTIAGRDQPVVRLGAQALPGVELRQARLDLVARSRYPDVGVALPVGGFDRELNRVSATLHLPPGWQLLAAFGPDEVSGGLLSNWTLLDCFLVFLMAVAAYSLRGWPAGAAFGLFLLLSWHEPDAPMVTWIFVLAGLALLRVAGDAGRLAGRPAFRRFALLIFGLSVLSLVVLAIPFVTGQLRHAVAPQIGSPQPMSFPGQPQFAAKPAAAPAPVPAAAPRAMKGKAAKENAMAMDTAAAPLEASSLDMDPSALIQTGPAMPSWHFEAISLQWKGPVVAGQTFRLILLPPVGNMLLGFSRVLLLGLALFLLFDRDRVRRLAKPAAVATGVFIVLLGAAAPSVASDFPSKELLDTLRARLTEPERCFPHCLGSPGLDVRLEGGRLTVVFEVDAAARTAVPLPVISEGWRPSKVLLDGAPAVALTRQGGSFRILAEAGRHAVVMEGAVPEAVSFSISSPLSPRQARVTAPGYRVRGIDGQGMLRGVLELTRAEEKGGGVRPKTGAAGLDVPAFFEVQRRLDFGLTFEATTEVIRRSPSGTAVVASVQLLPGELPDAPGVSVQDGRAVVTFAAGQDRVSWRSRLPAGPEVKLVAPQDDTLVETWTVVAAPFFDVAFTGIPPFARLAGDGGWQPRFAPWPGETLDIRITRPEAAPGEYLTIERAQLVSRQGEQVRDNELSMTFRAAKGTHHAVKLPPGAELTRLTVAGRETAPTGGPGEAGFALSPGVTEVTLHFREKTPLGWITRTPALDLGLAAVNVETRLEMSRDRWLLAVRSDTPFGPAVLYWGWLAAVLAIGIGVSAVGNTPLSRWGWVCYALGLSQATPVNFVLAASWLVALGYRRRHALSGSVVVFNMVQVLLVLLTLAGLAALYDTLGAGLLGLPRMQVAGTGSTAASLVWMFDRVAGPVPTAMAVTAPILVFRGLMLLWAVWLAWSLLRWLRWGFDCLTEGDGWRRMRLSIKLPGRATRENDAHDKGAQQP
jgi:hypothetical protein